MMMQKLFLLCLVSSLIGAAPIGGADRLIGVQSARVMSQSMPWIAQETGIFRKYNLEFPLVYIGTSPLATAAMLGGEAQILIDGGVGLVRTVLGGNNDLVFIAGHKKSSNPEHSRQAGNKKAGGSARQKNRCHTHRRHHPLLRRSGL